MMTTTSCMTTSMMKATARMSEVPDHHDVLHKGWPDDSFDHPQRTTWTHHKARSMSVASPIKWHGGKSYLAERIVLMMERVPHLRYVEPYGGACHVLFA